MELKIEQVLIVIVHARYNEQQRQHGVGSQAAPKPMTNSDQEPEFT
jgi:hypothetical protein